MKISIIAGGYAHSTDGIGRYTQNLVNNLKRQESISNIQVVDFGTPSLKKERTPNRRIPHFLKRAIDPFVMELNYLKRFQQNNSLLIERLKSVNSDIYHAVSPNEAVAAVKLNKRPLVTTFHDVIPLLYKNRFLMERTYFQYYSRQAAKSDVIIADSHSTKADLINLLHIEEKKIKVVYPGIDTNRFKPVEKKSHHHKTILYLGGLTKRKGIYEVIYAFQKAFQLIPDAELVIGGCGEELDRIKHLTAKLGINKKISFLGFVSEEELPNIYQQANLFVYPSKYEGFGYTPLEAMACGVPVITSNTSSLPEVVGKAGVTIDPNSIEELSNQMLRILSGDQLQNKMRAMGLEQAKKFSWENSIQNLLDIYYSLT